MEHGSVPLAQATLEDVAWAWPDRNPGVLVHIHFRGIVGSHGWPSIGGTLAYAAPICGAPKYERATHEYWVMDSRFMREANMCHACIYEIVNRHPHLFT